jgi:3-deoxy-D-manno-octulosonic-acid transferase
LYLLYNLLLAASFVIALPFLPLLGERFRTGLFQRLGWYSRAAKNNVAGARPVWIHGASVGEAICAARFGQELKKRFPDRKIILSTFTSAGNRWARQTAAVDAVIFLPLDFVWTVRRALSVFQPSLLIVLETEIWPNLLREVYRRGIPSILLSGRISARAFRRYCWFRRFFRTAVQNFTAIGMQTEEDAERIAKLAGRRGRIAVTGSLKRAMPGPVGQVAGEGAGNDSSGPNRRILVVGSSHRGEEEILLNLFVSLKNSYPDLQMVLAPRQPQRFSEVEKLLRARGIAYEKRSQNDGSLYFEKDVLFLDTVGDLISFYAIADIAFVGGTLVDRGGHNLLEPARFAKPVLFGPHTANVRAVATEMKNKGGGIEVRGIEELMQNLEELLADPEKRKKIGEKAYQVATGDQGVLDTSLAFVCRYLPAQISEQVHPADR